MRIIYFASDLCALFIQAILDQTCVVFYRERIAQAVVTSRYDCCMRYAEDGSPPHKVYRVYLTLQVAFDCSTHRIVEHVSKQQSLTKALLNGRMFMLVYFAWREQRVLPMLHTTDIAPGN